MKDIALPQVLCVEIAIVSNGKYIVIDAVGHVVLPCFHVACRIHISVYQLDGILRADASDHFAREGSRGVMPGRLTGTKKDDAKE